MHAPRGIWLLFESIRSRIFGGFPLSLQTSHSQREGPVFLITMSNISKDQSSGGNANAHYDCERVFIDKRTWSSFSN
jgi:hypothetical protein